MNKQPEPTSIAHSIGDELIILNDYYGHMFKIGTRVQIVAINDNDYQCRDVNGKLWYCADQNFIDI